MVEEQVTSTDSRENRRNLLRKSAFLALLATNISLLLSQAGVGPTYIMRGFPIPILNFNGCDFYICSFDGSVIHPLPAFYFLYALADYAIWFAIALGILFAIPCMKTRRRAGLFSGVSVVAGSSVTLLSLLVPPLPFYYPTVGRESILYYVGGFPVPYYERIGIRLLIRPNTSSAFFTTNFLTDLVFWILVSLAVIGFRDLHSGS